MTSVLRTLSLVTWMRIYAVQTTICVWNSIDDWDHLNGEYALQSGTHNGRSYWKQSPTPALSPTESCPQTPHYIYASLYDGDFYWQIYTSLITSWTGVSPSCESATPIDPTQCNAGDWRVPLTVTDGPCPSLNCDSIHVSNSGNAICDQTFITDNDNANSFVSSGIHFFFNQYMFKWYCSDNNGIVTDCSGSILRSDRFFATDSDGWTDVNRGETITLQLSNGYAASFNCIGPTTEPTPSPTQYPTLPPTINPTAPTKHPTYPTKQPTLLPTEAPSAAPTPRPTRNPTSLPTVLPTALPTISPTTNPTLHPTSSSTSSPTFEPTSVPTSYPTAVTLVLIAVPPITSSLHNTESKKNVVVDTDNNAHKKRKSSWSLITWIFVLACAILSALVIVALVLLLRYRNNVVKLEAGAPDIHAMRIMRHAERVVSQSYISSETNEPHVEQGEEVDMACAVEEPYDNKEKEHCEGIEESHTDSSDHNNDDLWEEPLHEGATENCPSNDVPETVSGDVLGE